MSQGHLRKLLAHSAVYGAADVFTSALNLLLFPVFTAYLSPAEYGTFALVFLLSGMAKIVVRLGLPDGFFRLWYEQPAGEGQRRFAGSIALFAALCGAALFALGWAGAGVLARLVLDADSAESRRLVRLALADVCLGTLLFVPLALLRIRDRPGLFSALSSLRHLVNLVLKVVLVVKGWGVAGILWSDLLATALFALTLLPVLAREASPALDLRLVRAALRFGAPKVPHGVMIQALNRIDRWILDAFVSRAQVGLYQVGYTLGEGVKFALSAFEPAWQPFVYERARRPEGPAALARVGSYALAAFVGGGLCLALFGGELLRLLTPARPAFWAAAPVVPVVALAYVLHGAYLLFSIGIAIEKRTGYYPLITAVSAAVNVAANLLLVPRLGILGAAWATVAAYGVMAAVGIVVGQRLYPLPVSAGRLARLFAAAAVTLALSALAGPGAWGLAVKAAALLAFPALLLAAGFVAVEDRALLSAVFLRERAQGSAGRG